MRLLSDDRRQAGSLNINKGHQRYTLGKTARLQQRIPGDGQGKTLRGWGASSAVGPSGLGRQDPRTGARPRGFLSLHFSPGEIASEKGQARVHPPSDNPFVSTVA